MCCKTLLHFFPVVSMNAKCHTDLVTSYILEELGRFPDGIWIIQQDNAPLHRAKFTGDFVNAHGIELLDLLDRSPADIPWFGDVERPPLRP